MYTAIQKGSYRKSKRCDREEMSPHKRDRGDSKLEGRLDARRESHQKSLQVFVSFLQSMPLRVTHPLTRGHRIPPRLRGVRCEQQRKMAPMIPKKDHR